MQYLFDVTTQATLYFFSKHMQVWFGVCIVRGACYVVQCAWHVWCGGALINVAIPATIPFIPPSAPACPALVLLLCPHLLLLNVFYFQMHHHF